MVGFVSFESAQIYPVVVPDLGPVARDLVQYFEAQDYEASAKQLDMGQWLVSLRKGEAFKTVFGRQTALNLELQPTNTSTIAKASIGVFGEQTVPIMVTASILWPVLLTQISSLVRQSNLDQEALTVVEQRLITRSREILASSATPVPGAAATLSTPAATSVNDSGSQPQAQSCTNCGSALLPSAKFCTSCGHPVVSG
jgi:hypothetical protein